MKNIFYILIVLGVFFAGICMCTNLKESNVDVFEIDIDKSKQINFTEWFDSIQIVPLETNDNSLIGLLFGSSFVVKDNLIYIFDRKTQSILIFDNNGKFIKNTSHLRGQGPNEYTVIERFDIDDLTGNLLILSPPSKMLIYNTDLESVNGYDISNELWPTNDFKQISDDICLFYNSNYDDDEQVNVFSIKENKIIKKIGLIEMGGEAKKMVSSRNHNFYENDGILCIKTSFPDNKIYYYDSIKVDLFPKIEFKIKQNAFYAANLIKGQELQYYRGIVGSSDKYAFIFEILESKSYYFLTILYREKFYFNRYDKETGENQVIDYQFLDGSYFCIPILVENNVLYTFLTESEIHQFIEHSKYLSEKYKDLLENISEDDNPYIVKYFIKD